MDFKGGTCLKKCYFETYRFSEDLDFTLRDEGQIEEKFLRRVVGEVVTWVADESGLSMPATELSFDIYQNPRGRRSCQGKIAYRGPVSPTTASAGWPKIKIDLTADERLVLPPVRREVFHPYADRPESGLWINSYAYEEAFGEKIRALAERTRPRDLYDVVNLYRHGDSRPSPAVLRDVVAQKCAYKGIAPPTIEALEPHRDDLEAMWDSMLGHQLPVLPPVGEFWSALPEVFEWIAGSASAPQLTRIEPASLETLIRGRVLPVSVPARARAPLEIIRFAAANHLCVELAYDGRTRRIEPYSLRQTAAGNFVLHAIRSDSGQHRSYRVDQIQGATVAGQSFLPRYRVELSPEGPIYISPSTTSAGRVAATAVRRPTTTRRASALPGRGAVYVYRCTVCRKTFERKSMDGSLNPHKHPRGYACPGRVGVYVRTKH